MNNQLPNSDWNVAISHIKTSLDKDLFQYFENSVAISPFVRDVFVCYPQLASQILTWHVQQESTIDNKALRQNFDQFVKQSGTTEASIMQQLRVFRRIHSAAIAVLELSDQLAIEISSQRISLLAEVLIDVAYHWSYHFQQQKFGNPCDEQGQSMHMLIIAMGKLGGRELNFSSDIDLIFFYPAEGDTINGERSIDHARFFRRVSTTLIKLLNEVTQDGFVFRVDMRLRPYGDSGALAMSLAQAEEYYQEQGREWERFAMVRARVLTGNAADVAALNDIIRPFSFRRYIDYGVIDSIRDMKSMIQREVRRKGLHDNIKLGAGGIREIEFIVQSLQLIQGGRDKRLREANTLQVLPLLVEAKLLPAQAQQNLSLAYRFLRRLENCIQELHEKQTQELPQSEEERRALSEVMGYASWEQMVAQLKQIQSQVNQSFNELLGEQRKQALTQDEFYHSLAEGHVNASQLKEKLQQSQQKSLPNEVAENFIELIEKFLRESAVINLSTRGSERLNAFFPSLLATCVVCSEPDVTLQRLLKVLRAILKRTAYLELLSENPPILQHLVDLAGRSEWVVQHLSEYPILFDELLYPNSLYEPLQSADLKSQLQQSLLRVDIEDEEEVLDTVRAFKQINELRVAAALLAERLSISQVNRYLTQIAEVVLQTSVEQCWQIIARKYGCPSSLGGDSSRIGFAVIGYGKLGGSELGFGSDLDLVFLFDQALDGKTDGAREINNSRFYTRLAQKLIHFLSARTSLGYLYEVDMRLRPSGSSGLLVSHIDAYRDYQMESAWTWEHQALIRARCVAGDAEVAESFTLIREQTLAKARDGKKLKQDVIDMRQKMRSQLEKKSANGVDLKQTQGGLVDIEFLAQYFCLLYPHQADIPHNTANCLKFAKANDLVNEEDAQLLIKTYRFYRNKLNEAALIGTGESLSVELLSQSLEQVNRVWQRMMG